MSSSSVRNSDMRIIFNTHCLQLVAIEVRNIELTTRNFVSMLSDASRSLLLSLASLCLFLLWFIIYQLSWPRMGAFGEGLAIHIPKGG